MSKYSVKDAKDIQNSCFKLNSLQLHALLTGYLYANNEPHIPPVSPAQIPPSIISISENHRVMKEDDDEMGHGCLLWTSMTNQAASASLNMEKIKTFLLINAFCISSCVFYYQLWGKRESNWETVSFSSKMMILYVKVQPSSLALKQNQPLFSTMT